MTENQARFASRTFAERSAARRAAYAKRYAAKPRRFDSGDAMFIATMAVLVPLVLWFAAASAF